MKRQEASLTLDGVTRTISEWGRKLGISPMTIKGRIERGWEVQEALIAPEARPSVTKNSAELMLNDMTLEQLPVMLAKAVSPEYDGNKLGEHLRTGHREVFDNWFKNVYCKNHK